MTRFAGQSRREAAWFAAAGLGGLTVLILLFVLDPATTRIFPPCPWRAMTGWLCPGCGSARAMHALLHGHLGIALEMNALAVAAVPLGVADLVQRFRGAGPAFTGAIPAAAVRALAVFVVGFGILRNVY